MFQAHSAHHQEVHEANCTYAASGIVTLCKWSSSAIVSGCTRRSLADSDDTRGCMCTICDTDLLMMGGMRLKHVGEFNQCNLCKWTRNLCIKLVIIKQLCALLYQHLLVHLFWVFGSHYNSSVDSVRSRLQNVKSQYQYYSDQGVVDPLMPPIVVPG